MIRNCHFCGVAFNTSYKDAKYCKREHADEAMVWRETARINMLIDEPQPDRAPLKDAYDAVCDMCGRVQGSARLDKESAQNIALVGLRRCRHCGGHVSLQDATFGTVRS